jgi:hypothetical protein
LKIDIIISCENLGIGWLVEKQSMRREGGSCEEQEEEDVLLYGRRRKDRRGN